VNGAAVGGDGLNGAAVSGDAVSKATIHTKVLRVVVMDRTYLQHRSRENSCTPASVQEVYSFACPKFKAAGMLGPNF
jgi:hypothetical protein